MVESKDALGVVRAVTTTGALPPLPPGTTAGEVAEAARSQRVAGQLLAAIERDPGSWGDEVASTLAAARRGTLVRTLGQISLGRRVLELLSAHDIRALPLKGVVLAETVYDMESDRPMSDVDVLALERWSESVALLRRAGFAEVDRGDHAWALRDPASGEIVELHRSVTSCPGLFPHDPGATWGRRRGGRGQLLDLPSPEDLLVQLALHAAFQHGLVLSLVQWLDFRRVLEREAVDPERLLAIAAEARAHTPLAAALAAAEAVVGARVPDALREALRGATPESLARWLAPRLAEPLRLVLPTRPDTIGARWELVRGPRRRAQLVWRTLFLPEDPDLGPVPGSRLGRAGARAWRFTRMALGSGTKATVRTAEADPRHRPDALASSARPSEEEGATADLPPDVSAREDGVLVPSREELLAGCLESFPWVRLTVTGECMRPALAGGEKVRLVDAGRRPPRLGDVVLARGPEGLRLHRLVWGPPLAGARWRLKADRGVLFDPVLDPRDVLATVVGVEGRPDARPRRPLLALLSLARGVLFRLRPRARGAGAEVVP